MEAPVALNCDTTLGARDGHDGTPLVLVERTLNEVMAWLSPEAGGSGSGIWAAMEGNQSTVAVLAGEIQASYG